MNEKLYYSAAEVAEMLGVSIGKSYKVLMIVGLAKDKLHRKA